MRLTWLFGGIVVVAAVGGCTRTASSPTPSPSVISASAAPEWAEPAAYSFGLSRGCDAAKPTAAYQVSVRDGEVTTYERTDRAEAEPSASADVELGPVTGDGEEEIDVPTLGQLLDMAQTAADDGGRVQRSFDAADGHPTKIVINTADDAAASADECWNVTSYTPSK